MLGRGILVKQKYRIRKIQESLRTRESMGIMLRIQWKHP